jgi:hypothetical protein
MGWPHPIRGGGAAIHGSWDLYKVKDGVPEIIIIIIIENWREEQVPKRSEIQSDYFLVFMFIYDIVENHWCSNNG